MLKSQRQKDLVFDSVIYVVLFIIMLTMLYPFYYVLIASFNKGSDSLLGGVYLWPRNFTLENYRVFMDDPKWVKAFLISVLRTVSGTLLGLLLTSIVAYGLSHRDLLFSKVYFTVIVFAMYFSGGLIPYYVVLRSLGLLNSFAVYIIPSMLSTFFLLIAISFFREIPAELKESAHIDGAGELTIFFRIILPVSTPVLATMALFMGVGQWNSWLDSAYFVQSEEPAYAGLPHDGGHQQEQLSDGFAGGSQQCLGGCDQLLLTGHFNGGVDCSHYLCVPVPAEVFRTWHHAGFGKRLGQCFSVQMFHCTYSSLIQSWRD